MRTTGFSALYQGGALDIGHSRLARGNHRLLGAAVLLKGAPREKSSAYRGSHRRNGAWRRCRGRAIIQRYDRPCFSRSDRGERAISIENMTCATRPISVRKAMKRVEGVKSVRSILRPKLRPWFTIRLSQPRRDCRKRRRMSVIPQPKSKPDQCGLFSVLGSSARSSPRSVALHRSSSFFWRDRPVGVHGIFGPHPVPLPSAFFIVLTLYAVWSAPPTKHLSESKLHDG